MKEVIDLFKTYGGSKFIDEDFLEKITSMVVAKDGSGDFLKNGVTTNEKAPMLFAQAAYERNAEKIHYYYKDMVNWQRYEVDVYYPYKEKLTPEQRIFLINLLMIETALHEIEHVNQEKKKNEDMGIEGDLLRLCDGRKETISTYEVQPSERLAEIISLRKVIEIARKSKATPEIMKYLEDTLKDNMLRGYEKTDGTLGSPSNDYLFAHGETEVFMTLDEALEQIPDVEERIMYGLPITQDEYDCYKSGTRHVTKTDLAKADYKAKFSLKEVGKKVFNKLFKKEKEDDEHGV